MDDVYLSPEEIKANELWKTMNKWYLSKKTVKKYCLAVINMQIEVLKEMEFPPSRTSESIKATKAVRKKLYNSIRVRSIIEEK